MKKFFSLSALAFMALMPLCLMAQMGPLVIGSKTREGVFYIAGSGYPFNRPYYGDLEGMPGEEPFVASEVLRLCIVRRSSTDTVIKTTYPGVKIDAAGQLVLDGALAAAWLPIIVDQEEKQFIVIDNDGMPDHSSDGYWDYFEVDATEFSFGENVESGNDYLYLVALDTRTGLGVCKGAPTHVARYAMAFCPGEEGSDTDFDMSASPYVWYINGWYNIEEYEYYWADVDWPGVDIAWKNAAAITSLTITQKNEDTQEEEEVTLTGEALADYLTPTIEEFSQANDKIALNLTDGASDVMYYTLYTKEKLSEEWRPFAEVYAEKCENNEKTVDKSNGKQYTRFCIDGNSPLEIPLIDGDISRFYMLGGDNLGE